MDEKKLRAAINIAQSASEEYETIKLYLGRMLEALENGEGEPVATYIDVIQEELKHGLQFTEQIVELTGIEPEDFETPREESDD